MTVPQPLRDLSAAGVSVWFDDLSRALIDSGGLARLVEDRGVVGVTSNPTIFAAALADSTAYEPALRDLAARGVAAEAATVTLTTDDVRAACDVLAPVHRATAGADGLVSIEIDPRLARDTAGTVAAGRALWDLVDRPNLMVKVPATVEGLPAITALLGEGISVNVTLIFALPRYGQVIEAHLAGLETARAAGLDLATISSVASFFVSRVDSAVDAELDALDSPDARAARGTAAIANARLAHRVHRTSLVTDRWRSLAAAGARPQRPLWASTGVKDPAYPDTRYVTELVTAGVVSTVPGATLEAVADHGVITGDTVVDAYPEAAAHLARLADLGIDLDAVTDRLETDGVAKFVASWEQLVARVADGLGHSPQEDPA